MANNASPEEIRDAFRALVRLLHPDHQLDEQLRISAERQMRKINRIYAVLSDPERRRRYDYGLEAPTAPTIVFGPDSKVNLHRLMARFAWIGAVLITVVILIWLSSEGPAGGPFPALDRVNAQKPAASSPASSPELPPDVTQLRSDLNAARAERDAAIHELTRLRGRNVKDPEDNAASAPAAATVTELPSSLRRRFAGVWVYARAGVSDRNRNTAALYPAEFIEATVNEQGGIVHGRYRSRYRIVDRPISPDVNFEFTGTAEGANIACPWSGPGGSRGELTMKLTGENAMEIEWTATELGSIQGLASGTARLTRREE